MFHNITIISQNKQRLFKNNFYTCIMSIVCRLNRRANGVFELFDVEGNIIASGDELALTPCMDEFEDNESYQSVHSSDLLSLYQNQTLVYLESNLGKPSKIGNKVIIHWTI
jgi:hypothetical protein